MFHLSKTHRLGLMILMAISYFGVELIVGHACSSVTLVADSFHMLSDVLALIVALGAVRMAKKPRDGRHTYGFQRAEILGTLVNTVMLVTLCFTIIVEAIQKLIEPHPVRDPKLIIYVGSGGLLINLIGILLFCGHSHGHSHFNDDHGHSHGTGADQLMEHQTLVVMTVPEADEAGAGDDDAAQPMKAAAGGTGDNGSPSHAANADATAESESEEPPVATARMEAAVTAGPVAGPMTPLLIEQAGSSGSPPAGHHSPSAVSPSLHPPGGASLRRASLGPSWLPSAVSPTNNGSVLDVVDGAVGGAVSRPRARSSGHMNMQAAFLHIMGDTLGSVIVIVSALTLWLAPPGYDITLYEPFAAIGDTGNCTIFEPSRTWQTFIDPGLSLLLVTIMLFTTIPLLRKALNILMQTVPKEVQLDELQEKLQQLDGITQIHDLHVWQLQSDCYIGTVHIRCRDLPEYINISREAKKVFHNFNIHCTTIQPEFSQHAASPADRHLPQQGSRDSPAGGARAVVPASQQCYIDCGTKECVAQANCCAVKPGQQAPAPFGDGHETAT